MLRWRKRSQRLMNDPDDWWLMGKFLHVKSLGFIRGEAVQEFKHGTGGMGGMLSISSGQIGGIKNAGRKGEVITTKSGFMGPYCILLDVRQVIQNEVQKQTPKEDKTKDDSDSSDEKPKKKTSDSHGPQCVHCFFCFANFRRRKATNLNLVGLRFLKHFYSPKV